MTSISILLSLLVLMLAHSSQAIYFHMMETSSKCFLEEVPEETMLKGTYRIEHYDNSRKSWVISSHGLHLEVVDPESKVILSRTYSHDGAFSFTSHTPGDYRICISSNSSAWFGGDLLRVHLDLNIGNNAQDYGEIAARDKLSEIQLRIRQLLDQVEMIAKDQSFQRMREERFRSLSESTNSRVTWWSIGQAIILLSIGFWQMRNLKSFFQAKKLV